LGRDNRLIIGRSAREDLAAVLITSALIHMPIVERIASAGRGGGAQQQGIWAMTSAKPRPPLAPGETRAYPVLPLRDIVVFPHTIVPLFVGGDVPADVEKGGAALLALSR